MATKLYQVWRNDRLVGNVVASSLAAARKAAGRKYGLGCVVYADR